MAELRERFIARCRHDAEELASTNRDTLVLIVHRLNGMAAMLGFDEIGADAGVLEDALRAEASDTTIKSMSEALQAKLRAL